MNSKTFLSLVAEKAGGKCPVSEKAQALVEVIRETCGDLDTVAIPAFGSFTGVKIDEVIAEDGNGKTLMPPRISVEFRPSVLLRKRIKK